MLYRLEFSTVRFVEGANNTPTREFNAPDDLTAIRHSEDPQPPARPLKVIWEGEAIPTVPRKLIELTEPPREVKVWF
jgi:hypothetical protein